MPTTQLTIRGFDTELEKALRKEARTSRLSLNQAAVKLLRRGAGLSSDGPANTIGDALDVHIGTWTDDDVSSVRDALAIFEQVDEDLWK